MDRLTISRRSKRGENVTCLPAGDGLPVWTKISLDAKLPMMQTPKDSTVLCTTKVGEPKHRCKQKCDFDLRDPNGWFADNVYEPLHDPHLKTHFSTPIMRRHLIQKGFISEDGKILCTLKQFNQYRRYLRHIFFLEIAKDRREELGLHLQRLSERNRPEVQRQPSHGSIVRRRFQQLKERDHNRLKKQIIEKTARLERRLQMIRDDMTSRERRQREEAGRRQASIEKSAQESENRKLSLLKRWRQQEIGRRHVMADKQTQRRVQAEIKCLARWNARKDAQKLMLDLENAVLTQEGAEREQNIARRENIVSRQHERLERKIEKFKQTTREEKERQDELHSKRLGDRLAAIEAERNRRKNRQRSPRKTLTSTWKLEDVLGSFQVPDPPAAQYKETFLFMLNAAIDDAAAMVTDGERHTDASLDDAAMDIVQGVIDSVKNDICPQYLDILESEDVIKSKSVRFNATEEEITRSVTSDASILVADLKPVSDHIVTPCASQAECALAESLLYPSKSFSTTFMENLLLRLLDDLNNGRLSKDDVMKLASYSMDAIKSTGEDGIEKEPNETEETTYLATSSSSSIALKMVDFTLNKILLSIKNKIVSPDDLASLTLSLLESINGTGSISSVSDTDLDAYVDDALNTAVASATDPRQESPVCDALLDDFMVRTLEHLVRDLAEEKLTTQQVYDLASSVERESHLVQNITSKSNLSQKEGVQTVLEEVLSKMQSKTIDFQTLYKVVFAIVYTYKRMEKPEASEFESKVTHLIKELLISVEEKAITGAIDDIDLQLVRKANDRLALNQLDHVQIENISPSIVGVVNTAGVKCKTSTSDMARSVVEVALSRAKKKVEEGKIDAHVQKGVQGVVEAIISVVPERKPSNSFVTVFLQLLEILKLYIEEHGGIANMSPADIQMLILKISNQSIDQNDVLEMATDVARVLKSPVKSESSFVAEITVRDSLKEILNDISGGQMDGHKIADMISSLMFCYNGIENRTENTQELLQSLSAFFKTVLDNLTNQLNKGELSSEDVQKITSSMRQNFLKHKEDCETDDVLTLVEKLVTDLDSGCVNIDKARDIGSKLIQCGQQLLHCKNKEVRDTAVLQRDMMPSHILDKIIDSLQVEISNGNTDLVSLREIAKGIIDTVTVASGSQMTMDTDHIASNVVMQTINTINRQILSKGFPSKMLSSIASTVISMLSGEDTQIDLPMGMEQYRPTIVNIIDCLRNDQVDKTYADEIFCLILNKYKNFVLEEVDETERPGRPLPDPDVDLMSEFVTETLKNLERNSAKEPATSYSAVPTPAHGQIVDSCIETLRQGQTTPVHDIVDFILEIVTRLQEELSKGEISDLSMAHFYQALTDEQHDLKTLEMNAADNLLSVTNDIRDKRERSDYVSKIVQTYLEPNKTANVYSDPIKAMQCILVNVSSEILTKFVKATLQTILVGLRGQQSTEHTPPSMYIMRSASSLVTEEVLKEVIKRIQYSITQSLSTVQGRINRKDIERIASELGKHSSRATTNALPLGAVDSKHSSCSIASQEIADLVLDTLHNTASNLRLELSMHQRRKSSKDTVNDQSQEIQDFVLNAVQDIVAEQQDKRSQIDLGITGSYSKYATDSNTLISDLSKEALTYVNDILHDVLKDKKHAFEEKTSNEYVVDIGESTAIPAQIVDTLDKVLSGTTLREHTSDVLLNYQREDVKCILIESIRATADNVRAKQYSVEDLKVLLDICRKVIDTRETHDQVDLNLREVAANALEEVLNKVQGLDLQTETLENLSSQLATLGMETRDATEHVESTDVSLTSSRISGLVTDVLGQLVSQMNKEEDFRDTNANSVDPLKAQAKARTAHDKSNKHNGCTLKPKTQRHVTSKVNAVSLSPVPSPGQKCKLSGPVNPKISNAIKPNTQRSTRNDSNVSKSSPSYQRRLLNRDTETSPSFRNNPTGTKSQCSRISDVSLAASSKNSKVKPGENKRTRDIASVNTRLPNNSHKVKAPLTPDQKNNQNRAPKPKPQGNADRLKTKQTPKANKGSNEMGMCMDADGSGMCREGLYTTPSTKPAKETVRIPRELKSLCGSHKTRVVFRSEEDV